MTDVQTVMLWSVNKKVPQYATVGSAGFDISACLPETSVVLYQDTVVKIPTGLKMAIPAGYELQIRSRSGMTINNGVVVANSPGTIDSDYRGEICILLTKITPGPFTIEDGMRIAQGVLAPVSKASFLLMENLTETQRGEGGFGSTGNQ